MWFTGPRGVDRETNKSFHRVLETLLSVSVSHVPALLNSVVLSSHASLFCRLTFPARVPLALRRPVGLVASYFWILVMRLGYVGVVSVRAFRFRSRPARSLVQWIDPTRSGPGARGLQAGRLLAECGGLAPIGYRPVSLPTTVVAPARILYLACGLKFRGLTAHVLSRHDPDSPVPVHRSVPRCLHWHDAHVVAIRLHRTRCRVEHCAVRWDV